MISCNNGVMFAITRDLNDLCHDGQPGKVWYVNQAERYQNHAKYAKGHPRYANKNGKAEEKSGAELFSKAISDISENERLYGNIYENGRHLTKAWQKAADLGLEAMKRSPQFFKDGADWSKHSKDSLRDWFLFSEDYTGLGYIAYLMKNKGYSAKDINKILEEAEKSSGKNHHGNKVESEMALYLEICKDWSDGLSFPEYCEQVLKEQGGRK